MRAVAFLLGALVVGSVGGGCGGHDSGPPDAAPPDANLPDAGPPQTLADTGLCADKACSQINAGIRTYKPRWELWSDGATKRRWIYLPPNATIDTSDMNTWHFPQGTKLWKEFTRDNIRVETRMYWKQGADDDSWFQVAYVWNAAQDAAVATPTGEMNANGTEHDVPARSDCKHCHDRTGSRILGFSAIQLDYAGAQGDLDLAGLVAMGALSKPPTSSGAAGAPYFPLWSDASANDIAAMGYLHANCGHCHNPGSDVIQICPRLFQLDLTQIAPAKSKKDTSTYTSTVKQTPMVAVTGATYVVAPADPDHSALLMHFDMTSDATRMPPLATEKVDTKASTILHDWIAQMK